MPISPSSTRFAIAEAVLSFVGAGIAGTLWWAHKNAVDLPCTSGGGCEIIAQSRWSHVTLGPWHDIPVALLGFLAYLGLLTLSMARLGSDSPLTHLRLQRLLWLGSAFGVAYSWYLQYVAHFRVGAFCVYCFSSALVMTVLFVVATWEGRTERFTADEAKESKEHSKAHV